MPVNGPKRCGLCGEKNHTVRTCQLPGAQKFRGAIRKTRPVHLKQKARVLRGNGVAAGRKPGKRPPFGRKSLAGILLDTLYLFDLTCENFDSLDLASCVYIHFSRRVSHGDSLYLEHNHVGS